MAQTPAQRQASKRARDAKKQKSFSDFINEIDQSRSIQAANVIADLSEQIQTRASETTALFRECFGLEESTAVQLCEDIIKFNNDKRLQQHWWRFLKELERHNTANVNKLIDKKLKEFKK